MKQIMLFLLVCGIAFSQTAQTTAVTVSASATPTFTANSGNTIFRYTLAGNVTSSTFASAAPGTYVFRICQPSSGGTYTYTFTAFTSSVGMSTVPTGAGNCLDQAATWDSSVLRFVPVVPPATLPFLDPTSSVQTQLNLKAPLASPTFTGTVTTPVTGSTQCLHVNSAGVLSGTGSDCGAGSGTGDAAGLTTVTYSATPTFAATKNTVEFLKLTLTGLTTGSTLTVASGNPRLILKVCENATGGYPHVWPTNVLNAGAVDTTAHYCTTVVGTWDGTNLIAESTTVSKDDGTRIGSTIGLQGSSSGVTVLQPAAAASGTLSLPAATDTLVGRATTDTLLSKTLAWGSNTIGGLFHCTSPGLGDGTNAIAAATYLQTNCYNSTGRTVTITGIRCFTDNSGSSTLNATNGAGTALLTGAVTCTTAFAAGTQSGTTTLANNDYVKFTFVADGSTKQASFVVLGTF